MEIREGQVAVVTGAASGIGLGIATAFVNRGLKVVLSDVEAGALDVATQQLSSTGGDVLAVTADVSILEDVTALKEQSLERFGNVDIVCNNAGVNTVRRPSWECDILDWQWVLGVNLWGVIHGIATFVPMFVERGSGYVVNTSSINGLIYAVNNGPYLTSKHGIIGLTETLALELAENKTGVGASVLCPGAVHTNIKFAERNRPESMLRGNGRAGQLGPPVGDDALTPLEVGNITIAGIERNQLHIVPSDHLERVTDRMNSVLADIPELQR